MTLEFLDKVYKEIFSEEATYLVNTSRVIGGMLVSYSIFKGIFQNYTTTGEVINRKPSEFSPYMLGRGVLLLFLVAFIPQILSSFDSLCVMIESAALKNFNADQLSFDLNVLKFTPPSPNETWTSALTRLMAKIVEMFNPLTWIGGSMSYVMVGIFHIIDFMIYPVFLAERYFIMGLLKMFAPLMVALSIYDKTRDYIYNLFKMYGIYFLVIIPYMFATVFVYKLQNGLTKQLYDNPQGSSIMALSGGLLQLIIIALAIVIKLKLYKRSLPFMKELIK